MSQLQLALVRTTDLRKIYVAVDRDEIAVALLDGGVRAVEIQKVLGILEHVIDRKARQV